jgi:alkylation response protein AidB-like acyl-CoA dehydrogenase
MTHGRRTRDRSPMADDASMQMRFGESAAEIDAALALLRAKTRDLMTALSGAPPDCGGEHRAIPAGGTSQAQDHAASCFIAQLAYRALERLMAAAGAHQLAMSEPAQRCFRDALAGLQQPSNNWDHGRVGGGRALLERLKPAATGAASYHDRATILKAAAP